MQGAAGRLDPLREGLPDLAARRHIPSTLTHIEELRVGAQPWHVPRAYDRDRDRSSECDVDYGHPDGLPGPRPPHALPPYMLDSDTRALIVETLGAMLREPPGLPHTEPPEGLPSLAHLSSDPFNRHFNGPSLVTSASPPPLPWAPVDNAKQHADRTAAGAVGPNGLVQRYFLSVDAAREEHDMSTFGLE